VIFYGEYLATRKNYPAAFLGIAFDAFILSLSCQVGSCVSLISTN
jgi:hypothetical protein